MRALSLPVLHKAIDDLEARLLRESLANPSPSSDMEDNDEDILFSDDEDIPRQTFGRLQGLGRAKIAPVIRAPVGPPGVLKSKASAANNFEIFVDGTSVDESSTNKKGPGEVRLADELSSDPDYQVSFYFVLKAIV